MASTKISNLPTGTTANATDRLPIARSGANYYITPAMMLAYILPDGDKGDITVSGSGATWTIDAGAVTYAKIQDVSATSRFLSRKSSGAGDVEECTLSEVLDFIGSAAQGDILYRGAATWARLPAGSSGQFLQTLGAGNNPQWAAGGVSDGDKGDITVSSSGTVWTIDSAAVSYAKIQNIAGLSVMGRSANSSGVGADITAANDAEVLRRSGTSIGFGTIATAGIADGAVTYAKMQDVSTTDRILGRDTAGAGDVEELTLTQVLDFVGSAAQGDVLYRNGSAWTRLGAGTNGQFLQTQGAGANPQWATGATSTPTFIGTQSTSSGTSWAFTSIPQTYKTLLVEFLGVSHNDGGTQTLQMEISGSNGATYSGALGVTGAAVSAAVTLYGGMTIHGYIKDGGMWGVALANLTSDETQSNPTARSGSWRVSGGIDAIRFSYTAGSGDAGTINLWGL